MNKESLDRLRGPAVSRRTALAATGVMGAGFAAAGAAYLYGEDAEPEVASANVSRQGRMEDYFPNVELITHRGERVRFYDDVLRDKTVVIIPMYLACDDYCPLTTANLLAVKDLMGDRVGRDLFFYGLTLDPVLDTPELLNDYAMQIGAGDGFTFLTGAFDDIELVRHKIGLFDPDPTIDADRSSHGAMAIYGNEPKGRWCGLPALVRPDRIAFRIRRVMDA